MSKLKKLMQQLGHQFKNPKFLQQALNHRSCGTCNNERLEFLGDSLVGMIIASELYKGHPEATEGELSRMRSSLVNGDALANIALKLGVNHSIQLGQGEEKSGGRMRFSILADALEAIIAAIYLDAGLQICRCRVLQWYGQEVNNLSKIRPKKDAKSRLQEWLQGKQRNLPRYELTTSGAAHAQIFTVTCHIEGAKYLTKGVSTNRRKAEQIAAQLFLDKLDE